jgi:clan AA aspartic protease
MVILAKIRKCTILNKTKIMKKEQMGHIYTEISLGNAANNTVRPVTVNALADTGALMLCIPEHIVVQLQLEKIETREVMLADGKCTTVPYVGPIRVTFGERQCFVGALVLGNEVLPGSVPMKDMDLVLNPVRQKVTVDPASSNIPHSRVKKAAA